MPRKLCTVETRNEAEVKRVKYIITKENRENPGSVEVLKGTTFIMDCPDDRVDRVDKIVNTIMSKTSPDRTRLFTISETPFELDEQLRTIEETFGLRKEAVESFIQFLIAKRDGSPMPALHGVPGMREYRITTKLGKVDVVVSITGSEDTRTRLVMNMQGYSRPVELVYKEFRRDINFYKPLVKE